MNSESKKEIGVGIFFLVLSTAYMLGTMKISTFTPFGNRGLDSRSVPLLIGGLTALLSIVHIFQVLSKEKLARKIAQQVKADEQVCDPDEVACIVPPKGTLIQRIDNVISVKLLISFLYLIIYVAAYQPIGFIISSSAFLIAESFLLVPKEQKKKWTLFIILFSIGASVLIYFIFTKYLTLFLPSGILG